MTTTDKAKYRRRLQALLSRATGKPPLEEEGEGLHEPGDYASHEYEEQIELALAENKDHLLSEVQAALGRLHDGTFGRCEECRRPVSQARLEALPYARLCVRCAEVAEEAVAVR